MTAFAALIGLQAAAPSSPILVSVERRGDHFIADFQFPEQAPAWGFFRSSPTIADRKSWRGESWTVLTPGVRLERRGRFDTLIATNGRDVPARVRVRLTPFTDEIASDYVPALKLGGDSVALFDGHFAAFSVATPSVIDTLPAAFDSALVGDPGTSVRFAAGRDFRLAGDVEGFRAGRSAGTYGLFGAPGAVVANGVATVIDSEMPPWIAGYIADFTPKVIASLQAKLGPAGIVEPTILAAWEGSGREGASMNGGTLKGLILMRIEGRAALTELPALRNMVRWFIAHEASHFWLGQSVTYDSAADSWIMEGGADLLAVRTVARLDPVNDGKQRLDRAIADCARLADQPIATAHDRGDFRVHYACGAVFALVAEKAAGGDFFAFTGQLIDANRRDRKLSRADWLAALDRASGKPQLSQGIATLLDQGARDPKAAITRLLEQGGIDFTIDADGVPRLS